MIVFRQRLERLAQWPREADSSRTSGSSGPTMPSPNQHGDQSAKNACAALIVPEPEMPIG
jgi:hypothetical protein